MIDDVSVDSPAYRVTGTRVFAIDRADSLLRARVSALAAACLLLAALWFVMLGHRPLYDPDEGRYAEIPREMLAHSEWVVPTLNGFVYIEKPPLEYWATALAFEVFGETEWSARLWSGTTGLATLALIGLFVARRRGIEAGLLAGLLSGSTLMMQLMGHELTLDMGLTFFLTAALFAFIEAQRRERATHRTLYLTAMWIALGFAVLTKGLVALLLPVMTLAIYRVLPGLSHDRPRPAMAFGFRWGIPLLIAMVMPWFILIQQRVPEFFDFFVIHEHFQRYLTPEAARSGPWWIFVVVLMVGSLPWLPMVVARSRTIFASRRTDVRLERILLLTSAAVILIFFSISHSKLVPYILPLFPIILALAFAYGPENRRCARWSIVCSAAVAAVGMLSAIVMGVSTSPTALVSEGFMIAAGAIAAVISGVGVAAVALRYNAITLSSICLAAGWIVAAQFALHGSPQIDRYYSKRSISERMVNLGATRSDANVFAVGTYDPSLSFYLHREIQLVQYKGEMSFGIDRSRGNYLSSLDDFAAAWQASSKAFAYVDAHSLDAVTSLHLPMKIIDQDPHGVIISRG